MSARKPYGYADLTIPEGASGAQRPFTIPMWAEGARRRLSRPQRGKPAMPAFPYDANSAVPAPKPYYPFCRRTLRREHGYSATKHDASVASHTNPLRRHLGHSYDVIKARNMYSR